MSPFSSAGQAEPLYEEDSVMLASPFAFVTPPMPPRCDVNNQRTTAAVEKVTNTAGTPDSVVKKLAFEIPHDFSAIFHLTPTFEEDESDPIGQSSLGLSFSQPAVSGSFLKRSLSRVFPYTPQRPVISTTLPSPEISAIRRSPQSPLSPVSPSEPEISIFSPARPKQSPRKEEAPIFLTACPNCGKQFMAESHMQLHRSGCQNGAKPFGKFFSVAGSSVSFIEASPFERNDISWEDEISKFLENVSIDLPKSHSGNPSPSPSAILPSPSPDLCRTDSELLLVDLGGKVFLRKSEEPSAIQEQIPSPTFGVNVSQCLNPLYACGACGRKFALLNRLEVHAKVCLNGKKREAFDSKRQRVAGYSRKLGKIKPLKRSYVNRSIYETTQPDKNSFVCPHCERRFSHKDTLMTHERVCLRLWGGDHTNQHRKARSKSSPTTANQPITASLDGFGGVLSSGGHSIYKALRSRPDLHHGSSSDWAVLYGSARASLEERSDNEICHTENTNPIPCVVCHSTCSTARRETKDSCVSPVRWSVVDKYLPPLMDSTPPPSSRTFVDCKSLTDSLSTERTYDPSRYSSSSSSSASGLRSSLGKSLELQYARLREQIKVCTERLRGGSVDVRGG